jgi:preprotein translocase subunit SecF
MLYIISYLIVTVTLFVINLLLAFKKSLKWGIKENDGSEFNYNK